MKRNFNWGIIGLGHIAQKFAEDLQTIPNVCLLAVASRSKERARLFAQKNNVLQNYGSYEEILDCPELDAIYIATPHTSHHANTIMCLKRGIPVLCEKPFAMNLTEVKEMIATAKENNTFLMEALWTRFLPSMKKVLAIIDSGEIGAIKSVKADFGFNAIFDPNRRLFNKALGGGSLLDVGIYPLFLSLLLLGKPEEIKATASFGKTNVDESCAMILKYKNNQIATLDSSIVTKTNTEAFIYGEKGTICMNSRWHGPTSITLSLTGQESQDFFFSFHNHGYRYEIEEVIQCLELGKVQSDLMNWQFSIDLMTLLDDVRMEAGIFYEEQSFDFKSTSDTSVKK